MIAAVWGALTWLRGAAVAVFGVIARYPWQALCIVLLCASLWFWNGKQDALADLAAMTKARDAEKNAHRQTVKNYQIAALAAQEAAKANVERVKQEQTVITERIENEYEDRLAATDARYRKLLREAAAADTSGSDTVGMPYPSSPACFADGTPCTPAVLAVLKDAEDNTSKLIALQGWAKDQAAVDVDGTP